MKQQAISDHIFIIDDDKFFAKYFTMKMKPIVREDVEFHHFTNLAPVFVANSTLDPTIIFLDVLLQHEDGFHALPELCERYPQTEIVLISGTENQAVIDNAIKNGATIYFAKDEQLMDNIRGLLDDEIREPIDRKRWERLLIK